MIKIYHNLVYNIYDPLDTIGHRLAADYLGHAGRLDCYSNIRTFYAKLLQIRSYKFYHAKENKIWSISPGGATFQTTSPLRTEAILFSQNFGSDPGPIRVWSTYFCWKKSVGQTRIRPKIPNFFRAPLRHRYLFAIIAPPGDNIVYQ